MYYNDVLDLIGNTPLMCLKKSTGYNIFAKAEFLILVEVLKTGSQKTCWRLQRVRENSSRE